MIEQKPCHLAYYICIVCTHIKTFIFKSVTHYVFKVYGIDYVRLVMEEKNKVENEK